MSSLEKAKEEKQWQIVYAVCRWCRLTNTDPRKATWWPSATEEARPGRKEVCLAIEAWLQAREEQRRLEERPTDFRRLDVDAQHSALLPWLLQGNLPLPKPPPTRFSYPDHEMAITGKVRALEVWRDPERGIDACVDQSVQGWAYVEGSQEESRFVFDQVNWGRWEFVLQREQRMSPKGKAYESKWWSGKRTS